MPTNLPAEAKARWLKVLEAKSPEEKLQALQEFLSAIPQHKGTEKLRAQVRAKIASLRREIEERRIKKSGGRGPKIFIEKEGDAQIVLLSTTGAGRSSLLRALTNAKPEIAQRPFTTTRPVPGMYISDDIMYQLIEAPPVVKGSADGEAWGSIIMTLVRNADGVIILLDASSDPIGQLNLILDELEKAGITVMKPKARVEVSRGTSREPQVIVKGRLVGCTVDDVKRLLISYKLFNSKVVIDGEAELDDVEEAILGGKIYKPAIVVANKIDLVRDRSVIELLKEKCHPLPVIEVSCTTSIGLESIGKYIFNQLELMRIYTKEPWEDKPASRPLVLKRGATVQEVAEHIHSKLAKNLKYARVWGPSVKYPGEKVGRDHVLADGDIVELKA
ncbi:MAG: TGS domain-containing protein [Candidatus Nezhaarchaeota archaeon]|nr:TGS domain-containing protein [Candidatus Nezhaarchaeota archaeon]MCX8141547.1 TGS domain-containing protein [Candidatus Nezhaarchaeota archaeon]MDW8049814.1 TGS domain-containing protein [Nitrososphaerota archaeon]